MVTTVADTLFHRLIDAFPADRRYGARDFSRDPMPKPVREYLEHTLALRLDDVTACGETWIDTDHPDVRAATSTYRTELSRHIGIPASAWRTELRLACQTIVSYLVQPAPTLTDLVFAKGNPDATLEDISRQLRFLPAYSYFQDVIGAYFDQKDLDRISRERFAGLARRIDQQMARDFDADEWVTLLEPLLEVVGQIPEFSEGLPVDVMKTILEEKGADALLARLDARFLSRGIRFIPGAELRDFFARPLEEPADQGTAESSASQTPADGAEPSHRNSHVPLWKQFESGGRASDERAAPASPIGSRSAAPPRTSESQPLWKQFHGSEGRTGAGRPSSPTSRTDSARQEGVSDAAQGDVRSAYRFTGKAAHVLVSSNHLSDLERSVLGPRGNRNRDLFLKHLFSGSEGAYEDALRKLNAAQDWSEASQIIAREVFLKHQVNIYSDPAVAFTDAAEAKFRT